MLSSAEDFGGAVLLIGNDVSSVQFLRNTVGLQRGRSTALIHFTRRRASLMRVEDNILSFSRAGSGVFGFIAEGIPDCRLSTGSERFDCLAQRGGRRDPESTFDGNLIYGCLNQGDVESADAFAGRMSARGQAVGAGQVRDYFEGIESARPNEFLEDLGNRSCGERLDAIFEPGNFNPRPEFAGKGADPDVVTRALGEVGDVAVEKQSSTSVRISYRAPDEQVCHVDYSTDGGFAVAELIGRVSDGGGDVDRGVLLEGLQPSTDYAFRVQCAAQQPRGVFRTDP